MSAPIVSSLSRLPHRGCTSTVFLFAFLRQPFGNAYDQARTAPDGGQLPSLSCRGRLPERLHGAAADTEANMARKEHTSEKPSKGPTHGIFVVEGDGNAAFWTRIGAAWAHQDGNGFNLSLVATPLSGRIVLRANKEAGE
jgi:hypothetical protein